MLLSLNMTSVRKLCMESRQSWEVGETVEAQWADGKWYEASVLERIGSRKLKIAELFLLSIMYLILFYWHATYFYDS